MKLLKILLTLTGLSTLGVLFLSACSSSEKYTVSDHYNGNQFFNPYHPNSHGFSDFIKMLFTYDKTDWPRKVKNTHTPSIVEKVAEDEIVVTFVNHATLLVQVDGFNILTDPVWSKRVSPFTWIGPSRVREPGITFAELPSTIDLVVISHNHYDHMDLPTIKKLNSKYKPLFLVPLGDKRRLEKEGVQRIQELDWWQSTSLADLQITMAPTQHFSSRGLFDRNRSLWGSYFFNYRSKSLYFGGDAGYSPYYKEIRERLGAPDLAFIPIGAYEPNWFMKPVHMNPREAVRAHRDLESKKSIGIHFGTFQLTEEGIHEPVKELKAAMDRSKLAPDQFTVLGEGQTATFRFQ